MEFLYVSNQYLECIIQKHFIGKKRKRRVKEKEEEKGQGEEKNLVTFMNKIIKLY